MIAACRVSPANNSHQRMSTPEFSPMWLLECSSQVGKNHRGRGFEANCVEKKRGYELFRCLGQGDTSVPETTRIRVVKPAARVSYKHSNKKNLLSSSWLVWPAAPTKEGKRSLYY